jgi:hypothetical protein
MRISRMNKDVVYLEKGEAAPYICFGSKLARNLVMGSLESSIVNPSRIYSRNWDVVRTGHVPYILDLIERVGIVSIEWVELISFFDTDNTRKIMEGWDE